MLPKRPGRQQDPAVSGKAEDAGQAESIPGDRPSPVRCLDQGARSGELGAGRRPGRLGGSGNTSHLGPSPCPPHSVLGAQHPSPSLSRGGPEHTPHAWEPSSWAVRAGGQALSRGLRRGFPGRPQPGRGFRGEDARGQPRGGACRAPGGGTAAGWGHPRGRSGPGARRRWRESGKPTPGAPLPAAPLLTQISPRQEHWSGLPFTSPGNLPDPEIKPVSPALAGRFFITEPAGKPKGMEYAYIQKISNKLV